jgi:hypothetical protein
MAISESLGTEISLALKAEMAVPESEPFLTIVSASLQSGTGVGIDASSGLRAAPRASGLKFTLI